MEKGYFISAIDLVDVGGGKNVPTVLWYRGEHDVLIGESARSDVAPGQILNEDFKVELGNADPTSASAIRRRFLIASGGTKTAGDLTGDFLHRLVSHVRDWLTTRGLDVNPALVLAEPLAMRDGELDSGWLSNYRRALERILLGQRFSRIDFLPEPFAVFQYYRHGMKHPLVAGAARHNALVIDFGGGTFDVCVVSTTKDGDISQSGRNSRPLAADSVPMGGFKINRLIAVDLYRKHFEAGDRTHFKKAVDAFSKWRANRLDLESLDERYAAFIHNINRTIYDVESVKLALSRSMPHWALDGKLDFSVACGIPANPFESGPARRTVQYSAHDFRNLFVDEIWSRTLKGVIRRALERAENDLNRAPVTVVLLSGGSANIRWINPLLKRDFPALSSTEILTLDDYQEVVAKGLAVECARRFFTAGGDFASTTYNTLCLLLRPDEYDVKPRPFVAKSEGLPAVRELPGVLLPSASIITAFSDRPMVWRVRLDHPPKTRLEYWFLRSQLDPGRIEHLLNVEQTRLTTPHSVRGRFDQDIKVELRVSPDGTARPRFVYKSGQTEADTVAVDGRPFYLDSTFIAPTGPTPNAYVGLDFGTSNSSVSYVDHRSVQVYVERDRNAQWSDLAELATTLPWPLAEPLSRYFNQQSPRELASAALEFTEGALALLAFAGYMEMPRNSGSKLFKGFTQRSAGPLLGLLRDVSGRTSGPSFSVGVAAFLKSDLGQFVSENVTKLGQIKHQKAAPESVDTVRLVQIIANTVQSTFQLTRFGYFEDVKRQRLSQLHAGRFRMAHGNPPFMRSLRYEGGESFDPASCWLIDMINAEALELTPLMFWDGCAKHNDAAHPHCYLFDRAVENRFEFKAVGTACTVIVDSSGEYRELWKRLNEMTTGDVGNPPLKAGVLEDDEASSFVG